MENKAKLIHLRESTSQRIDLSSEEQDRVYSKLAFNFLESKEMDEVVETIGYMTTGGGQECLSKIVDSLILKNEFGYAINTIGLIQSTHIREEKYIRIIEIKIKNNDRSRIEYLKTQLTDKKLLQYVEDIIDDPKRIKTPEHGVIITFTETNEEKIRDVMREILKGYTAQARDKLDKIFDNLTENELTHFSDLIEQTINSSKTSIRELEYLLDFLDSYVILGFKDFKSCIIEKINKIHKGSEFKYAEERLDKLIDYIVNKRLKKIYKKNHDVIPELDNELLAFLKSEIEKSNIVKISNKIPNTHTLFKLGANQYAYLPEGIKEKDIKSTLKKLRKSLVYSYINNYIQNSRN